MGGGNYSYARSMSMAQDYSKQDREEVFSQRYISEEMRIKDKVREARDSEEHPNSFPVIIALDVTGSMGRIPYELITEGFPKLMKKIMDEGVQDLQVCFVGIGDHYTDRAPIQVGQFESSDELLDKWLKLIWLEGRGGGNNGESYSLAWYFGAFHTAIDSLKRGKRGVLITIGDEPIHGVISASSIMQLFGETPEADVASSSILKAAQESWDVYHINLNDHSGGRPSVKLGLEDYLGDHVIHTEDSTGKEIPEIISGIVLKSYYATKAKPAVQEGTKSESETITHLR